FWEPGINQIYLNILLYLEGFVFKRGKWIIPLIVFAIITTYSTTGIFIMIIVLFFIFLKSIKKNPILYILLGLLIAYPLYYLAKSNFENKSVKNASSMNKRIFDLVQPLSITAKYPITGIGLDLEHFQRYRLEHNHQEWIKNLVTLQRTEKGSSNSITFLISATGIPVSFFLLYCFFTQNLFTYRKKIFLIIVIISAMSEPLLLRPFFLILIISGMFRLFHKFTK
ncbi:MAG: O-antigen ligase family protein, partial [Flavobacteriales bacterium]